MLHVMLYRCQYKFFALSSLLLLASSCKPSGGIQRAPLTSKLVSKETVKRHINHHMEGLAYAPPPAYNQITIPLFVGKREGCLYVNTLVDGKRVRAIVDTGTSWIVWPYCLHRAEGGHR